MKLRELEKRLEQEPDNLGLRVQVAGLMREAGRSVEAVELYRSVAIAYRDQGRTQQAIAVCRSVLAIAPDDTACQGLLATLEGQRSSARAPSRPSFEDTPLPRPVPHHVLDPTSQRYRLSQSELQLPLQAGELTPPPGLARERAEDDVAAELDTRKHPRLSSEQLAKLDELTAPGATELPGTPDPDARPTPVRLTPITNVVPRLTPSPSGAVVRLSPAPTARDADSDDLLTEPRNALEPRGSDDDLTLPRDRAPADDDK